MRQNITITITIIVVQGQVVRQDLSLFYINHDHRCCLFLLSWKSQHTHFEDKILDQICWWTPSELGNLIRSADKLHLVPALSTQKRIYNICRRYYFDSFWKWYCWNCGSVEWRPGWIKKHCAKILFSQLNLHEGICGNVLPKILQFPFSLYNFVSNLRTYWLQLQCHLGREPEVKNIDL